MDITLIAFAVLILVILFLYMLYQHEKEKLSDVEMENIDLKQKIMQLNDENSMLREEMKVISKNRREADEKINELHSGDSVTNAINGLCKH